MLREGGGAAENTCGNSNHVQVQAGEGGIGRDIFLKLSFFMSRLFSIDHTSVNR